MFMLNNIRSAKITPYKNINKQELRDIVWKIFSKPSVARLPVMYTGEVGMWNFYWILTYGDMLHCIYYIHSFKRVKSFKYISLFNKSGDFKLKVTKTKFEFFKGTTLLKTIDDVVSIWVVNSGDIHSPKTKEKIKEVNDYIKYLEKL